MQSTTDNKHRNNILGQFFSFFHERRDLFLHTCSNVPPIMSYKQDNTSPHSVSNSTKL